MGEDLEPSLGARGHYVRKTVTQLPSKMRFVAAQFNALLEGDLWLDLALPREQLGQAAETLAEELIRVEARS